MRVGLELILLLVETFVHVGMWWAHFAGGRHMDLWEPEGELW